MQTFTNNDMKADHGATPIPLPNIVDDPRWIGRFSREVRKSIAALRDRKIIVRGRQGRGGGQVSLPWQVTANGDDTVTVNEGTILVPNYRGADDEDRAPIIYEPVTFDGDDDLEITAAGYLYARLEYSAILSGLQISWLDGSGLSPGFGAGLSIRTANAISVIFSSSDPATISPADTYTHWPIAQVDLQDGVASVTKQILMHNLTHDLVYIHVSSSP